MRWLDVMPHLASRLHLRRVRIMTTRRGGMVSLLALVGMLVLLAGCGSGTTLPQLHLAWQQMTMPPQTSITSLEIGVAPSDGDVVYVCDVDPTASQHQLHLWVTRDRSVHWTHLTDLTVPSGSDQCSIVVDELQPATAIASVNSSPTDTYARPPIDTSASFATLDGGATWRQLSGQSPFEVHQLATRGGITYAILWIETPGGEQDELATSDDKLLTWQPNLQTQSFGLGRVPYAFWLDPASNAVLIAGANGVWRSDDGGSTWTAQLPPLDPADHLQQVVFQTPHTGQPWHLCAESDWENPPAPPNALICSFDGGKTWLSQPSLNERVNGSGNSYAYPPADVFALDGNGAVLAGIGFMPQGETFYRLAPQAQQWQVIGNLKGATSISDGHPTSLNPTPSGDVIWSYSIDQGWFFAPYPPAQP